MTKKNSLPTRIGKSLCLALALTLASFASASDSVWVRVHHAAEDPALQALRSRSTLSDYGSFQWGQLSRSELAALEAAGASVTALDNPFVLTLGGESFDPLDAELMSARFETYQADPSGDWHLVQFSGPVRQEWLQSLQATGVQVAQALHPFSYFVWGTQNQINSARSIGAVRWSGAMQPEWKVQPHLRGFGGEVIPTMALASAHVDPDSLREDLSQFGEVREISALNRHFQIVHLDAPGEFYQSIGQLPAIYTVQRINQDAGTRGEMSNQSVVGNIGANGVVFPGYRNWLTATGFDGSGVIVGIVDSGTNINHVDLLGRFLPCSGTGGSCTGPASSHGTHVAGAVAGTGASGTTNAAGFLRGQGVAPGANLVVQRYNSFIGAGPGGMVPDGMLRIYRDSATSGALLTNNSWGPTGTPQGYDIPTQQIDFISRDALPEVPGNQPVLAVWSIMNGNGDSGGACAPSSLASPDEAKNLFAVGSTSLQTGAGAQAANIFRISPNSAHGPACDGRQVPHIVAPGCSTDSTSATSGSTGWGLSCGTSMASPVVSGAVAIWAQKYIEQTASNPSPALVKAVFTAAAQDLVGNVNANGQTIGHRPDRFQGFGRLDLDLVMNHGLELFTLDQTEVFTEVGESWSLRLQAVDPEQPIRLMLAWTDAPGHGLGGTTPAWVNDLNLVVEAGDNTYFGNVIGSDGWSAAGGNPDARNNLEGIFLSPSQHQGVIDVSVIAAELKGDALNPFNPSVNQQDFALACYNCQFGEDTFTLATSPTRVDMCLPASDSEEVVIGVNVGAMGEYSGTVALSIQGEPSGVSSVIDPEQVVAPGSADWTLSISADASAGEQILELIGDDGEQQKISELALRLDAFLSDGPVLSAPVNGLEDVDLRPTLMWREQLGAQGYRLQLANDADFSTLVLDESLGAAEFQPSFDLELGTEYFWRVAGNNLCGEGEWSATFSFTTRVEPAATFSAESFSVELPQNTRRTLELTIINDGTGALVWSVDSDQPAGEGNVGRFSGDFEFRNWLLVNTPTAVAGSVNTTDGPPAELRVTGGDAGVGGNTDYQITMPASGTIHFDWGYQSSDIGDFDTGGFVVNGNYTQLATNDSQQPLFSQSRSVELDAGDLFAFRVSTQDGDFGAGVFGVRNFVFELGVCGDERTPVDWLSVTPGSGSVEPGDRQVLSIELDTLGLEMGDYQGFLCFTTNDPNRAIVPIEIALTVIEGLPPAPRIAVQPAELSLSVLSGGLVELGLSVANLGGAELEWELNTTAAECGLPAWLSVDPLAGNIAVGASESLSVSIDTNGLDPGTYQASLCLSSNDPETELLTVPVELLIQSPTIFQDRFESP